jgi:glycosyltransferase involved in cell wall biosynthesis
MQPVLLPYVSVVIPVYNRIELLRRCLTSLFLQTYPADRFEIIVVDDGSTEDVAGVIGQMEAGWDGRISCVRKANGGPASARNAGIHAAKGDVIAFTDSDCEAEPSWLELVVGTLEHEKASGVGGPISNVMPPGWISGYLTAAKFYRHRVRHGRVDYLVTANAAFQRSALLAVRGFNEASGVWGEDADLSFRLSQSGHRLLLASGGAVKHYGAPISLNGWARELFRYGKGNAVLSRNWQNGRSPLTEFVRHGGAVLLAPALALKYRRDAGLKWAVSFIPLIVVEHVAFMAGLINGVASNPGVRKKT